MRSDIAISVKNLTKTYRIFGHPGDRIKQALTFGQKQYHKKITALRDVSFEIKKGETVGIVGRNGSGKSTLLQLICGILKPTSGSVEVNGRISALLELGAGFNPEFTGRENVYFQGAVTGFTKAKIDAQMPAILAFADIGDFIDQPVRIYSSGMFVRLAFAVVAHSDADILIVDEALAVGDAYFQQKCIRYLREFMNTGTVLFVSHDTTSIKSLCNVATLLEHGAVRKMGRTKDVCDLYTELVFQEQLASKVPSASPSVIQTNWRSLKSKDAAHAPSFGQGGAKIFSVQLVDTDGSERQYFKGGEKVTLRVSAATSLALDRPIVGFFVKDKLGQTLFGDNTFLSYADDPVICAPNSSIFASFEFTMPTLSAGTYSINVAIANGTQSDHVHLQWIHDAIVFASVSDRTVTGLVGIPIENITLRLLDAPHEFSR